MQTNPSPYQGWERPPGILGFFGYRLEREEEGKYYHIRLDVVREETDNTAGPGGI